jgi:anti-sigma regulatory factor (Ser/Thr protein kinase)
MSTVQVSFTALPAHVRTARLVALAVARRAGVPDELLDEVRLAVGEACSRAVGINLGTAPEEPVTMLLSDDLSRFTVEVGDVGSTDGEDPAATPMDAGSLEASLDAKTPDANAEVGVEALPPGFGLAVISGLVEDVEVSTDGKGTRVRMAWPSSAPAAPAAR